MLSLALAVVVILLVAALASWVVQVLPAPIPPNIRQILYIVVWVIAVILIIAQLLPMAHIRGV